MLNDYKHKKLFVIAIDMMIASFQFHWLTIVFEMFTLDFITILNVNLSTGHFFFTTYVYHNHYLSSDLHCVSFSKKC